MSLKQITPPAASPVTIDELKEHLKVEHDVEDDLLARHLAEAVRAAERYLRRQLITATWKKTLDRFPRRHDEPIRLERPPLQSVTSVEYVDANGDLQTLDPSVYAVDVDTEPGRIILNYGLVWPTTRREKDAVRITYLAGYGDAETDVPADYHLALCYLVAHYHRNRDDAGQMPPTVRSLLGSRAYEFAGEE